MPALARRMTPREPDALAVREVDYLVSKLLSEINVPYGSFSGKVINQLADLKKILSTDYMEVPALPSKPLLKELARIVETDIKQHIPSYASLADLENLQLIGHLERLFGPRQLELRHEPYRTGAGLSLRGFYCRADVGEKQKFVIFVNTAHHPGAVGATLGHELGHFIYGSLVGEKAAHTAFMEGAFGKHLVEEDELFADSLVALAAYSPELIKKIGGVTRSDRASSDDLLHRIKSAYELIAKNYDLDLSKGKMAAAWRVRYLTSMAHFFKLRGALYRHAGV
ncbi:MAG TPA: hypothetical protein VGR40_09135, partial [Candidatus Binatus sp.]|nr:hypothetical protein [Candidatus Binatus sp.]